MEIETHRKEALSSFEKLFKFRFLGICSKIKKKLNDQFWESIHRRKNSQSKMNNLQLTTC